MSHYISSESVSEGHPDKIADQISDGILDECLRQDPASRVAVETALKSNLVVVAGEVRTTALVNPHEVIEKTIERIGYTDDAYRDSFACEPGNLQVLTALVRQSPDIAQGVDNANALDQGAGDQGMMYGYACDETAELMPLPIAVAHRLAAGTTKARKAGEIAGLRPDSKAMVTVAYADGKPIGVPAVVISVQHDAAVDVGGDLRDQILESIVRPAIPDELLDDDLRLILNPTGKFVLGGAYADAGVTGRKIIVDTYGGVARHGGGAFSGKDPSKVDRSAAYAMRWVAKHIVASGAATKCEVQVAYAIGVSEPVSVMIETFGTERADPQKIAKVVRELFDLRPAGIIRDLDLCRPIYVDTAAYGHFGRTEPSFPWEQTRHTAEMARALGLESSPNR
ncbi:methionine adenosyltransferase [Nocardia amamiensis]|uniref:methionine adenosyltransferase n=1 Tax=Nocardia amamiensis TaxID=404578 RepID=UPI0008355C5E|nr:methionine adenosyltransferase [Nocardia amamiensis]